jgi:protein OPY2
MHIGALLGARDCIDTSACATPTCSCSSDQTCQFIGTDCTQCAYFQCVAKQNSGSSGSHGVSAGAVAGAVIGSLIFLALTIGFFLWYRRTQRRSAAAAAPEVKDVPASAADVLNRPDPMEKHHSTPSVPPTGMNTVRVYSSSSNTTIDLDPESQSSTNQSSHPTPRTSLRSNPFDDNHSIQTTGTEGTNVIPIALVAPESLSQHSPLSDDAVSPMRPVRSPELDLNLDHVNISHDSLKQSGKYPTSTLSGVSGISRNSYMSSASYSSDFLNEAPMIITPNKGAVRQVLGVVKAEMVNAPGHSSTDGLKPTSKPAIRSPLAASSFGPSDLTSETGSVLEEGGNPFSDKHSTRTTMTSSPAASRTTFGEPSPALASSGEWAPTGPNLPWARSDEDSRPSSISTQAGSVVDIANATRVNFGLSQLTGSSVATTPRTPYRTTMGRLISPPTSNSELSTFEQQQQRALAHAQAQAQAQGGTHNRRISASSAMSGTSTRADSILESFPFVPPSPISNRPARSPPLSPAAQQSFKVSPPSPLSTQAFSPTTPVDPKKLGPSDELPAPPDRKTLGLSTGSQLSTASTGLGSFPFQIDTGNSRDSAAPSAFSGRQRASLDTLAITSDLSSFPLGFDRDSVTVPPPRKD